MSRDQLSVIETPNGQGRPGAERRPALIEGRRPARRQRPDIDLDELWAPVKPERAPEDREFLPAALEILETPAPPARIAVMYAICGLVAAALAWSWFGHLDVYADATGKVQASGRTKVVEPLDKGTVIAVRAKDGDRVKEGEVLIELDPTTALADLNVATDSLSNARAEIARRKVAIAAAAHDPIDVNAQVTWPAEIPKIVRDREEEALHSDLGTLAATLTNLQAQKTAAEAQRDKFQASIVPQQGLINLIDEHVGMKDELFKNGWNSRATVLELLQQKQTAQLALVNLQGSLETAKAAIPVIETEIAKTRQTFIETNTQTLVSSQQKADELVQTVAKAKSKLDDMTLKAPISGVVQASAVTTLGQIVSTGQQLMQVVPDGTPLEIEAYVLNTDAGFVKVGQEATIKVDTFPYTRYGTISGVVTKVATDALTGAQAKQQQMSPSTPPNGQMSITSAAQQTSDLVFPVIVVPSQTTVKVDGRPLPLTSGMTATVEIKTESRRAIDYILSPIQAVFATAAQER